MRIGPSAKAFCFAVAKARTVRTAIAALTLFSIATDGYAQLSGSQPTAPVNIPLYYYFDPSNQLLTNQAKLAINVGIQGGAPRPYIFDTGSVMFNAAYGDWWGKIVPPNKTASSSTNNIPGSMITSPGSKEVPEGTSMNNVQYCYGGSTPTFCRGWTGNLVQVSSLSFHKENAPVVNSSTGQIDPATFTKLEAPIGPEATGYVINAGYLYGAEGEIFNLFPFDPDSPPMYEYFWGVFGAGNFLDNLSIVDTPENRGGTKKTGYWAGGVLGQTIVSRNVVMAQGYVVAANGQQNPFSSKNPPQQVKGIDVTIGGQKKPVTPCSPCVTVGLTPEMLGQFWAATPTPAGNAGVIPWAETAKNEKGKKETFQNPYDSGSTGNNASIERGTIYETSLTPKDGEKPVISEKLLGILDTGTSNLAIQTNSPNIGEVSSEAKQNSDCLSQGGCAVNADVRLMVGGVDPAGLQPIQGLKPTSMELTNNSDPKKPNTYDASLNAGSNTIGLPFFVQNSVMYDLDHEVIGYTPFFVTDALLETTAGGPLIVDGNNVWLGLAGVISGAGGVEIRNGGRVQLSATNTYAGLTQVFKGAELLISGPGSIAASSGVLNDGVFDISRAWSDVSIQDLTGSGDTYLGRQSLIVTNATGKFSGTISDGGSYPGIGGSLVLTGGALTLSGANTYTGLTRVNQGATLTVNGSIVSNVAVSSGGLLGGSGSVGATAIGPGGVLAPGNSIGTMTVNGDLTLNPDAIYEVEANAQGKSDKVIVKGIVNLTGATLFVLDALGVYKPKTNYVIIDNDGTDAVNGKFGEVINTLAFLDPSVTYNGGDGNDVVLTLERISFGSVAQTPNHLSVALALDQFSTDHPLFLTVLNQTASGARQAFDALSGEIHATVAGTLADDSRYVREAVLGRLMQAIHTGEALSAGGPQVATDNSQAMMLGADPSLYDGKHLLDAPAPVQVPLAFWTRAFGAWGDFDTDGNAASADRDLGGFISGMDANIGGSWRVGLATGASFSNVSVDARYSSADVETYQLGGYLGGMAGPVALRGGGMWAWNNIDTSRAVIFPGFYERQTASYDVDTGQLFGEIAYPTQMGRIGLEPFGGLAFVSIDSDRFRERGGALASLRGDADQDVGYSTVGLRAAYIMQWDAMLVTPHISAAWQHAFDDVTPDAALVFASNGIGFTVYGVPLAEDSALIDAGLDFALGERTTAGVSYSGQFGDGVTDNGVKGRFTWLF